ncbi:MAG TPA: 50S ribosomal protein L29 [Candidatus Kaiserbacteria bacterium]|nr:50S ribosomal protein L29 [Candidatus Kaiserbacteria bacterium]
MSKKNTYTNVANEELVKILSEKKEELRVVRFAAAGSRPKDSSVSAKLRKEIARILTEFSARTNARKRTV